MGGRLGSESAADLQRNTQTFVKKRGDDMHVSSFKTVLADSLTPQAGQRFTSFPENAAKASKNLLQIGSTWHKKCQTLGRESMR
jgi:hypothetical protein